MSPLFFLSKSRKKFSIMGRRTVVLFTETYVEEFYVYFFSTTLGHTTTLSDSTTMSRLQNSETLESSSLWYCDQGKGTHKIFSLYGSAR